MATTTIVIAHKNESATRIAQELVKSTKRTQAALAIANHFRAMAGGLRGGNVAIQTDGATAAAGTIALTFSYSDGTAGDSFTLGPITLTEGTDWDWDTDDATSAASAAAAINADSTLSTALTASAASGVVTVTARTKTALANLVAVSKSVTNGNAITFTGSALAGGAGGTGATTTYKYGVS